jgi:GxxExxY protein
MNEEEIIKIALNEAFYIHKTIGPGMLENVYKTCLAYRLRERGLFVETEKSVPVFFEAIKMDCGYRADIVVEGRVIIDTKTIDAIADIHIAQILTYLRFLGLKHGLILNFKTPLFIKERNQKSTEWFLIRKIFVSVVVLSVLCAPKTLQPI